jgi:hypothetical protein
VLYLRSFGSEKKVSFVERQLVNMLKSVGPVVAVGRPGDGVPRLGAARLYLADSEWQPAVSDLMGKANLVVLVAGPGGGLRWELTQCVRLVDPARLMVVTPAARNQFFEFAQLFKETAGSDISDCFHDQPSVRGRDLVGGGIFLWRDISKAGINGLVTFDADWQPVYHPAVIDLGSHDGDLYQMVYTRLWHALTRAAEHQNQRRRQLALTPLLLTQPSIDKVGHSAFRVMRVAEVVRFIVGFGLFLLVLLGALR